MASALSASVCGVTTTKRTQKTFFKKSVTSVSKKQAKNMLVWQPHNNKMFETFSYLPPLSDNQLSKQVDYIVANGWVPCLEFANPDIATVSSESCIRMGKVTAGYYDNRYWTMWKLPMFGCSDAGAVFKEIDECSGVFPDAFIRLVAFDNQKQVQILSFLVHRPQNDTTYCPVENRSMGGQ